MDKLKSRKFWICVAAFLGSVATSIAGLCTSNQTVVIIGTVCGIFSAALYAACEAYVDGKAVNTDVLNALLVALTDDTEDVENNDGK